MRIPDDMLMAYVDGELAPAQAVQVEAAMAADPAVAEAVARQRGLRRELRDAFAPMLDEPVPEHLLVLARAEAAPVTGVVPLPAARPRPPEPRRWALPEWSAMAAALVIGVAVSQWILPPAASTLRTAPDGSVLAGGALAEGLERQLASAPGGAGRVAVGLSFRDRDGAYCRSFALGEGRTLAGLACRSPDGGWRVPIVVEAPLAPGADLRQASSTLPEAVLAALEARIAGEPLDADQERRARDAGWR